VGEAIVLVGGAGFVGGNLAAVAARDGWEVHVADRIARPAALPLSVRYHELSATDEPALQGLLAAVRPAAVVDLAAVADIDRAEREPDLARAVNVDAAAAIAGACAEAGAWCLYFSSDAVFDGTRSEERV
jgi:dTDP-4-dehydrorhamnose reductase